MTKLIFFYFLTALPLAAQAKVIPIGISSTQISDLTYKFGGLTSLNTSNSPFALGEDLEFEITGAYQDLETNEINNIGNISSTEMLEPLGTIRKGLYWNIDISFTFILPVESQVVSGHLFSLSHSSKALGFLLKPELYISNYNVNDILNLSTSGFSFIAYKKISFFYLGLGGRVEFIKGKYEDKFLGSSTLNTSGATEADITYTSGLVKVMTRIKRTRLTGTYSLSEQQQSMAVSIGVLY